MCEYKYFIFSLIKIKKDNQSIYEIRLALTESLTWMNNFY